MPRRLNLAKIIEKQLPAELVNFMWVAGEIAHTRGEKLYLVGGVVRDLLLEKANLDLDLVVEGNAIELGENHHPPPFQHRQTPVEQLER
jgi:tRNA nucleotidyltransferase (CCA-adding enzyme)